MERWQRRRELDVDGAERGSSSPVAHGIDVLLAVALSTFITQVESPTCSDRGEATEVVARNAYICMPSYAHSVNKTRETKRVASRLSSRMLIMDTRGTALCLLLLLAIFLPGNTTFVSAEEEPEVCKYRAPLLPFCKSWSCKPVCKLEAAIYRARLQEHECIKGGIKGICYCLFCRKHWELD
ncbi:hypothetical protein ZWY2020_007772 [Hordeum vulgare]|nr:hypothetical protein ZWY2020_007772 [Hordeum vulgare]